MSRVYLVSSFFAAIYCTQASAQSLLVNGDFESPTIAANSFELGVPTEWANTGEATVLLINGQTAPAYPPPQSGAQFVLIGFNALLSQSLSLATPQNAVLRWFDATNSPGAAPYRVSLLDDQANVIAAQDFVANAIVFGTWQPRAMNLSLPAGASTLELRGLAAEFGNKPLIDNVTLLVPEPTVVSLAAIVAAAGVACQRGRRR